MRNKVVFCSVVFISFFVSIQAWAFDDVASDRWGYDHIETLADTGITSGCDADNYCPDRNLQRAEMAIFLLRSKYGSSYSPDAATGNAFNDVSASFWAGSFVERLAALGITSGCDSDSFCPSREITRSEMAIFLLRTKYGSDYQPPSATGNVFGDISSGYWAGSFIEQLNSEGWVDDTLDTTRVCAEGNFCPSLTINRAEMAVFLVRVFDLESSGVENNAPVASDGTLTTDEDTAATGSLSASDVDGDSLTYEIVSSPSLGTIDLIASTGAYTYTPNDNANGTDIFTFIANDGTDDSNTATVTVTINPVNDAPVAEDGTLSTSENTAASGTVSASDVDGDTLTFSIDTNGSLGTAVMNDSQTGAYTYTPNTDATGTDTFTFVANDSTEDSEPATITVTIIEGTENVPPVADAGTDETVSEGDSVTLYGSGSDQDGTVDSFQWEQTGGTTVALTNADTARASFTAPDVTEDEALTFELTVTDNDGASDSDEVVVTVQDNDSGNTLWDSAEWGTDPWQ
ncbi:MAG: tandem-95 repeat protein [Magnetococcales bacterium]|nr:tandem-95 repeat protein [Magnetococcales bacterium]